MDNLNTHTGVSGDGGLTVQYAIIVFYTGFRVLLWLNTLPLLPIWIPPVLQTFHHFWIGVRTTRISKHHLILLSFDGVAYYLAQ